MNKTIGLLLVVYGPLVAGISYLVYHLAPGAGTQATLIAGLVGGALCLVWGARGLARGGGKALPLLTLIPVCFVLLSQTFMSWSGAGGTVAMVTTVLLALSLGMLVRIAWSGTVFDVPKAGATKQGDGQAQPGGSRAAHGGKGA